MKCCGRKMVRVDLLTHWCGNCGTIRSRWLCRGMIGPNLHICATCTKWGPDGRGAVLRCHREERIKRYTSPGLMCEHHTPINPHAWADLRCTKIRVPKRRGPGMLDGLEAE